MSGKNISEIPETEIIEPVEDEALDPINEKVGEGETRVEHALENNLKREQQRHSGRWSRFQGEIGEGIAERVATEKLGLIPDPRFDQSRGGHGIDAVYLEGRNRPVVIEAKCDEREIRALREDQMQPEWVDRNARLMLSPENERFTSGNAEIGQEILDTGAARVRRIVITTNPATLEVKAFEGQSDLTWKVIGKWYADEFEQPF